LVAAGVLILVFYFKQRKKTQKIERLLNDPKYKQPKLEETKSEPLNEMKNDNNNKPPESAKSPESSKSPESESNPPSHPLIPPTGEKQTKDENIKAEEDKTKKPKNITEVEAKENQMNRKTDDNNCTNNNDQNIISTPNNNNNINNEPRRSRSETTGKKPSSPTNLDKSNEDSESFDKSVYTST
jgi:hypothetical protein